MVPNPVLSSEHQTHISSLLLDILNWLFSGYFKCNRFTGNTLSSFHPPPTPLAYSDLFHFRTWTISFQSILLFWRRNKTVILACPKQSNGFPLYTRWSQNFLCPMSNIRLTYPLQPHLLLFPVHSKFKYSTHIHSNYAQLLVDLPTWGSIIASAFTWYLWDHCMEGIQPHHCQHWPRYVICNWLRYVICKGKDTISLFQERITSILGTLLLIFLCISAKIF